MMIRVFVLVIFAAFSGRAQDSALVNEFCTSLKQFSGSEDIEAQISAVAEMTTRYLERNPMTGENPLQENLRFQYRLIREVKKTCANYPSDRIRLAPTPVYDLEDKLTKQEIESLSTLTAQIQRDKGAYLYIVTIDYFYPDSTIADFSNRYRDFWAPRTPPDKGVVLVVFSMKQRGVRVSTSDIAMDYLTNKECDEVIQVMVPHFKKGRNHEGLLQGLYAIKARL